MRYIAIVFITVVMKLCYPVIGTISTFTLVIYWIILLQGLSLKLLFIWLRLFFSKFTKSSHEKKDDGETLHSWRKFFW